MVINALNSGAKTFMGDFEGEWLISSTGNTRQDRRAREMGGEDACDIRVSGWTRARDTLGADVVQCGSSLCSLRLPPPQARIDEAVIECVSVSPAANLPVLPLSSPPSLTELERQVNLCGAICCQNDFGLNGIAYQLSGKPAVLLVRPHG
ncbi:hypothetical protein B0H19DRAFT_229519 [Mycena capillaripes]|nr:hypothetical protein B0H19DRAFT_229519 [Mycena capillaripes]